MKRAVVVITVVFLFVCLAQICQAADLQAGWYVKLGGVALFGYDSQLQYKGANWIFNDNLGTYGPFQVTSSDLSWPQRMITVPNNVYNIAPGTKVDLTGALTSTIDFIPDSLQFVYDTFYDVNQMRFDVYIQHANGNLEKIYSETRSGQHGLAPTISLQGRYSAATDSLIFRTMVVPEPSQFLTLLLPAVGILGIRRRILQ